MQKEEETCSIGMFARDNLGRFIEGKNMRIREPGSVFAAEAPGVFEVLQWAGNRGLQNVAVETDSLLMVQVLKKWQVKRVGGGSCS